MPDNDGGWRQQLRQRSDQWKAEVAQGIRSVNDLARENGLTVDNEDLIQAPSEHTCGPAGFGTKVYAVVHLVSAPFTLNRPHANLAELR